jgi:hypothetical protein
MILDGMAKLEKFVVRKKLLIVVLKDLGANRGRLAAVMFT